MDDAHKIGTVNLGSNVRDDREWGMNLQNWGSSSPAPNVPTDFFAMHAYTRRNLTAGHTYEVWVTSDDGYQIFAHKLGGGAFNITPNALNGVWQGGAYGHPAKWTFVAPESEVIGFEGSTGWSTGIHTHVSVRKDSMWGTREDPLVVLGIARGQRVI